MDPGIGRERVAGSCCLPQDLLYSLAEDSVGPLFLLTPTIATPALVGLCSSFPILQVNKLRLSRSVDSPDPGLLFLARPAKLGTSRGDEGPGRRKCPRQSYKSPIHVLWSNRLDQS